MHTRAKKILDFWFKETPPKKRFQKHKDFDALIKNNFLKDYELASSNEYDDWQDNPLGSLSLSLSRSLLISSISLSIVDITRIKNLS